jgi:hypothetical protein
MGVLGAGFARQATSMPSEARDSEGSTVRRGLVVAGVGRVDEDALDAVEPLDMDEDAFRTFYDLTSGAVWAYLSHVTGDPHAADDLLQETYIRFLGVRRRWESDAHRRNYLSASPPTWRTTGTPDRRCGPSVRRDTRRATGPLAGGLSYECARPARSTGSPRERQMLCWPRRGSRPETPYAGVSGRWHPRCCFARKKLAALFRCTGEGGTP